MSVPFTEAEIIEMEAAAKSFYDICRRARQKLQPVSTGGSKKTKGISGDDANNIVMNRRKRLIKPKK